MNSCLKNKSMLEKLKNIFAEFAGGKNLNDESVIDKLLTLLETAVTDESGYKCFVDSTNFWSYASSCLDESTCVSGKQYALILQLISRIARYNVPVNNDLTLLLLRKACSDKTLWSQTCVRIAWLRGMSILTGDVNLSVYNSDNFSIIRSCTYDKSWFVRKNAISLVVAIIDQLISMKVCDAQSDLHCQFSDTTGVEVCNDIRRFLTSVMCPLFDETCDHGGVQYRDDQLTAILEIIHHLRISDGFLWCFILVTTPHNVVSKFIYLLECCASQLPQGNEVILLTVLQQLRDIDICKQEIQLQIISLVWSLLEQSNILVSISVASLAIQWNVNDTWFRELETIILLPLQAAMNSEFRQNDFKMMPFSRQEVLSRAFDSLTSSKRLHSRALKLSITCMLKMVNNRSFINYVCDFLISTFDQHSRAFCLTSISNLRILCFDACSTLLTLENLLDNGCIEQCRVFKILLLALNHFVDDHQMLAKVLHITFMSTIEKPQTTKCEHDLSWFLTEVNPVLQKAYSSPGWNVRDTVIEFLLKLLHIDTDKEIIHRWIINAHWHNAIWLAVDDIDNFVRATSLHALSSLFKCKLLWLDLTSVHVALEIVRRRVLDKLRSDPSEFVRRAATSIVVQWQNGFNTCNEVILAMRSAITDPDREVQLAVIKFWEILSLELLDDQATNGSDFLLCTCLDVLVLASSDYDRMVRVDALAALIAIKCKRVHPLTLVSKSCASDNDDAQFMDVNETNNVHSLLYRADWEQCLQLENKFISNSYFDNINALLDDVHRDLMSSAGIGEEVVIDCY